MIRTNENRTAKHQYMQELTKKCYKPKRIDKMNCILLKFMYAASPREVHTTWAAAKSFAMTYNLCIL